jgi:ABC-type nitrate/sulfonate/bicarbonate transport system permease component
MNATIVERPPQALQIRWYGGKAAQRTVAVLAPLGLLALWEMLVRLGLLDVRFFPSPLSIIGTFERLAFENPWPDSLGFHVLVSLSSAWPSKARGPTRWVTTCS